ncbi:hypothetical protein ADL22_21945 [Streptomyces sp. NRRL F-4489]|uniref:hypothetical protein n=1 Tax=Streptomyces sp. NRRL F-4489 TaxID=1609095 RepID=UPI00074862E6|nr:hypothetical protein [Streptomyces sp. NRRL F-4489]KUL37334.1 hypothetical protein ADL22_21945 [Streptomyces sp. NRRL F-4489]
MPENAELRKVADFLATQPAAAEVTYDDLTRAKTREELGISSLNMILILVNYLKEHTGGTVALKPEWVSRLNDVEGILSVFREIDRESRTAASA